MRSLIIFIFFISNVWATKYILSDQSGLVRDYNEIVKKLQPGDILEIGGASFTIGDFLGSGNVTLVYELQDEPDKVIRIPLNNTGNTIDLFRWFESDLFIFNKSQFHFIVEKVNIQFTLYDFLMMYQIMDKDTREKIENDLIKYYLLEAHFYERIIDAHIINIAYIEGRGWLIVDGSGLTEKNISKDDDYYKLRYNTTNHLSNIANEMNWPNLKTLEITHEIKNLASRIEKAIITKRAELLEIEFYKLWNIFPEKKYYYKNTKTKKSIYYNNKRSDGLNFIKIDDDNTHEFYELDKESKQKILGQLSSNDEHQLRNVVEKIKIIGLYDDDIIKKILDVLAFPDKNISVMGTNMIYSAFAIATQKRKVFLKNIKFNNKAVSILINRLIEELRVKNDTNIMSSYFNALSIIVNNKIPNDLAELILSKDVLKYGFDELEMRMFAILDKIAIPANTDELINILLKKIDLEQNFDKRDKYIRLILKFFNESSNLGIKTIKKLIPHALKNNEDAFITILNILEKQKKTLKALFNSKDHNFIKMQDIILFQEESFEIKKLSHYGKQILNIMKYSTKSIFETLTNLNIKNPLLKFKTATNADERFQAVFEIKGKYLSFLINEYYFKNPKYKEEIEEFNKINQVIHTLYESIPCKDLLKL